jgi:hypothetical protein
MGRQFFERFDLYIFDDLFDGLEFVFDAFDGEVLSGFDGLGHENLREGAVSFLFL